MYKINGVLLEGENPRILLGNLLSSVPLLKFWSEDALEKLLYGCVDIVSQYSKEMIRENNDRLGSKRIRYSNFLKLKDKILFRFGRVKSREDKLKYIYGLILSMEGKGLLPGFGFSNSSNFQQRVRSQIL